MPADLAAGAARPRERQHPHAGPPPWARHGGGHRAGARAVPGQQPHHPGRDLHPTPRRHRPPPSTEEPEPISDPVSVATPEEAARLAGAGAVPLPELSKLTLDDIRLTLSTEHRTVVRATPQRNGRWAVSEVPAFSVLVNLRHAAAIPQARAEFKAVTRAVLPAEPAAAVARLDPLRDQYSHLLEILTELRRELTAQQPRPPAP